MPRPASSRAHALSVYPWAGDRDHRQQLIEPSEVIRICCVERQSRRDRGRSDHQVGGPALRATASANHRGGHLAVCFGSLGVERDWIELVLGSLKHVEPPATFCVLVILGLFAV